MQPMPQKPKNQAEEKENHEPEQKKGKGGSKNQSMKQRKKSRKRAESFDERYSSENRKPSAKKTEEKKAGRKGKDRRLRSRQDDDGHRSYSDERWRHEGRELMPRQRRGPGGPPQKMFDSDYDHDPRYPKGGNGRYRMPPDHRFRPPSDDFDHPHYYRGGPPPLHPREVLEARYPPRGYPAHSQGRGAGGGRPRPGPPPRGGPHMLPPRDFERPERPGYYAGNRPFRMDKIRDQPLESLHNRAADQIERDRKDRLSKNQFQHHKKIGRAHV